MRRCSLVASDGATPLLDPPPPGGRDAPKRSLRNLEGICAEARPEPSGRRKIVSHELRKLLAIGDHHRRARLMARTNARAMARNSVVARDPARDGIARLERANQSDRDIVAIDRKSAGVGRAQAPVGHRGWRRPKARQAPPRKRGLSSQTASARSRVFAVSTIARSARRASLRSVGQAGTSLSHSISVGVAPSRRIAVA